MTGNTMDNDKSLAEAMRTRARWLREKGSDSFMESGWGDSASVQSALLFHFAFITV